MHFTPWRLEFLKVNTAQYIPKTELARKTRQVINSVLRGQPAVVESYGQPEVAIIDIVDYYPARRDALLRAPA